MLGSREFDSWLRSFPSMQALFSAGWSQLESLLDELGARLPLMILKGSNLKPSFDGGPIEHPSTDLPRLPVTRTRWLKQNERCTVRRNQKKVTLTDGIIHSTPADL